MRSTILVVEDDVMIRDMACAMFEEAGFEVIEAATAALGLRYLHERADEIAAAFIDIRTPGPMDGSVLADEVARAWPHMALIVTSGEDPSDPLPRGAVFLPKPWLPRDVLGHVGKAQY